MKQFNLVGKSHRNTFDLQVNISSGYRRSAHWDKRTAILIPSFKKHRLEVIDRLPMYKSFFIHALLT